MTHDSTPHRVLKISELTRLIAGQLVLISRKSAVNLACACRSLEEPVLSTLWETQSSLFTLLGVLPKVTWEVQYLKPSKTMFKIVGDPSPEDWNRVWRHASWMHEVRVEERMHLGEETFKKLRLNSPPGGWFPALQDLFWCITESNILYIDLFLSLYLERIISVLPTSSRERMSVGIGYKTMPWAQFKDSFSSFILRCGPSFTEYDSPVPLSNAALDHLIHLPHLRTWRIHGPPPTYPASSLPLVFPPLRELTLGEVAACGWLTLGEVAACGWLPLLRCLEGGASTTRGATPLSKAKELLKVLNVEDISGINIDPSFVSTIRCFRNLVRLNVEDFCHHGYDDRQCIFKLNNDNIIELAMTLTQLEFLLLGYPCPKNTCLTTVACLLPISVHCSELKELEIHFNTTNIVDDFRNILGDPRFQQLRSLPRCSLTILDVSRMPLSLDESGSNIVAKGMVDIFPSLTCCKGHKEGWSRLTRKIVSIQGDSRYW